MVVFHHGDFSPSQLASGPLSLHRMQHRPRPQRPAGARLPISAVWIAAASRLPHGLAALRRGRCTGLESGRVGSRAAADRLAAPGLARSTGPAFAGDAVRFELRLQQPHRAEFGTSCEAQDSGTASRVAVLGVEGAAADALC